MFPPPRCTSCDVKKAFILGAGLGNRLRPLTLRLPKPLVPLFHRPLAAWVMDACTRSGIEKFAINTHHLPEAWATFPVNEEVAYFHEPLLLETGGGLKNIASWIGTDPILVHNGDIFSTLPLEQLIAAHERSGRMVTLALRSEGVAKHIAIDSSSNRVIDIREMLGTTVGTHVFSGIYCVNPEFLEFLPAGEKISVIPAFLELAKRGELGAIVLDDGVWLDLGDRNSYLQAHAELGLGPAIHPAAILEPGAQVEHSVIGPGAHIRSGAVVRNSVVWADSEITGTAVLDRCIICTTDPVSGNHCDEDL